MPSMAWMGEYQPWYVMVGKMFFVRMFWILYLAMKVEFLLFVVED
jgi:hypothetical protein